MDWLRKLFGGDEGPSASVRLDRLEDDGAYASVRINNRRIELRGDRLFVDGVEYGPATAGEAGGGYQPTGDPGPVRPPPSGTAVQGPRTLTLDRDGRVGPIDGDLRVVGNNVTLIVEGPVNGNVQADGSVTCGAVEGDVEAGGSVRAGDVGGDVEAGGSVACGTVNGDVEAGGSITSSRVGSIRM